MMSKSKSPLVRGLRALWLLPLVCLAIGLQARTVYVPVDKDSENNSVQEISDAVILHVRADGSVESGGKVYTLSQLKDIIPPHAANLAPYAAVTIMAADDVPMGVIDDVKMELRKLESLKVSYASASGKEGATRYMPPLPPSPTAKKANYPDELFPGVKRENIFVVRINSNDKIFFGDKPRQDDGEMLRVGKEFLRKQGKDSRFFSLTVDRGASYGAYSHMQSLLRQIYEEVRDEKAHEVYGKSLHELTTDEQSQINRMVPMGIFEVSPEG
jgi:biopolymer transport protein ExbD